MLTVHLGKKNKSFFFILKSLVQAWVFDIWILQAPKDSHIPGLDAVQGIYNERANRAGWEDQTVTEPGAEMHLGNQAHVCGLYLRPRNPAEIRLWLLFVILAVIIHIT